MKLILLGSLLTSLAFSVMLNLAFYNGRLTPEQQLLAMDCSASPDPISCIGERELAQGGR
jgi:hypothetical protein